MDLTRWKQKFRGPLDSALLNGAFEEIYRELGFAVMHLQEVSATKETYLSALAYQLQAINSLYAGNDTQVTAMNTTRGVLHRNMYDGDGLTVRAGSRIADVSSLYGVARLPAGRKMSFVPQTYDANGYSVADPSLSLYIDGELQEYSSAAIYNMLHRNDQTIWFETGIGVVARTIRLDLPKPPAAKLNYVEIQPVPNFTQTIDSFLARDFNGNYVAPYADFPDITRNAFESFENNSFNDSIQFDLTPWNVDGGVNGIRYFDCGYIDYIGNANLRFSMVTASTINNITHISHTPQNREFTHPGTSYLGFMDDPAVRIYIRTGSHDGALLWDNMNYAYPQDSGIPIAAGGVNTLYVDIDFYKTNDSTPVFNDITVYFI